MTNTFENAREELLACATWLGYQHENLSYGLKCAEDGLRLFRYGLAHPELAEMCDEQTGELPGDWLPKHFKEAIGYNPFRRYAKMAYQST